MFLAETEESTTPDMIARREGFGAALRKFGIQPQDDDCIAWGWTFSEFESWWSERRSHTAIVCWSERAGGQLLKQCERLGIDVPGELSIVGFDSTAYSETTKPRMTAVRQPIFQMANHAARILLDLLDGRRPAEDSYTFPCTFDVRDSTARPTQRRAK